jgi:TonB family protein
MKPTKDDIRRRLGLREVPTPPDDLLRQLKADIPPSFRYPKHLTTGRRDDSTSAFRGMSWQVAASFLVLTLTGVGVYMVTFETQNQETAKIAEADRAPEREFSPPMSPPAAAPADKAEAAKPKLQTAAPASGFSYEIPPPPPPPPPRQSRADAGVADGVEGGVVGGVVGGVYGGSASGIIEAPEEAPASSAATASANDQPGKPAAESQLAKGRDDRYAEEKDTAAAAPVQMPAAAPMARATHDEKTDGVHREPSPALSETAGMDLESLRAQAAAGEPLRAGGLVRPPVIAERVEIVYPKQAREAGVQGVVIVEAVIGRDGRVKSVRVLKTLPMGLEEAAVTAVKQWKFKPATLEGKPVDVRYLLTVNAKLVR